MSLTDVPMFRIMQACWDEEVPSVMWVIIQSESEIVGDFAARLWWAAEWECHATGRLPQQIGKLCDLSPRHLDGSPEGASTTTVARGLKANRCAFGLPWLAGPEGIKDQRITFAVEVVPEEAIDAWEPEPEPDAEAKEVSGDDP